MRFIFRIQVTSRSSFEYGGRGVKVKVKQVNMFYSTPDKDQGQGQITKICFL